MSERRRLLVINPNTSSATTERIVQCLAPTLATDILLESATARFGAPYIACEASYAVASHALLDTWAYAISGRRADEMPDGVLIACFGDPGLFALREASSCPISALAEASFIEAAALGPFTVVTGGERWRPMLTRLAQSLGFGSAMRHIVTVTETGAQLQADPALALRVLTEACQRAAGNGVQSIILGGAGLAGYAAQIQPAVVIPVIDSVQAGARVMLRAINSSTSVRTQPGFDVRWHNLSAPLTELGLPSLSRPV